MSQRNLAVLCVSIIIFGIAVIKADFDRIRRAQLAADAATPVIWLGTDDEPIAHGCVSFVAYSDHELTPEDIKLMTGFLVRSGLPSSCVQQEFVIREIVPTVPADPMDPHTKWIGTDDQ